jgi:biopolymer transport protein ExbB/TolQ
MYLNAQRVKAGVCLYGVLLLGLSSSNVLAQSKDKNQERRQIFYDQLTNGQWAAGKDFSREGGPSGSKQYIYLKPSDSPAGITGLSIPIRQKPGPGEFRYVTFRWVKWGGKQIGLRFIPRAGAGESEQGKKYNFTYLAGQPDSALYGLPINDRAPGNWVTETRDLWKDFGNFTLTGLELICPDSRDAGFDEIVLGQTDKILASSPGVIPTQVTDPVGFQDNEAPLYDDKNTPLSKSEKTVAIPEKGADIGQDPVEIGQSGALKIDWQQQLRAGGVWMYPLYVLAAFAALVTLLRLLLSRRGRLAPRRQRKEVRAALQEGNFSLALEACENRNSTLGESLKYILIHRQMPRETVSQVSGDIAGREIREQLDKIYPLSIVASLAPLLGLLGTIVGMIEAFGLVALYGDEGGPALLSDSISKALITTAAGLIIAIPAIAIYFFLKRRIKATATVMEVELENALTVLYSPAEENKGTDNSTLKEDEN